MNRAAEEIRRSLSMPQVLHRYGLSDGTRKRIRCPLHDGKDKNFAVFDKSYRCFVCNESGGVIDFAMRYFNLDFTGAINRLNDDFALGIPLGKTVSAKDARAALDKANRYRAEISERQRRQNDAEERYYAALDRWLYLDTMRQEHAPTGITEAFSDAYAYALHHIDAAEYELQQAQNALYDLKHERG